MKIRHLLKRRNKAATHFHVYLALYERDSVELITSGHTITIKEWSKKENGPRDQNSEVFKELVKIRAAVHKVIQRMQVEDRPVTPLSLKEEYYRSLRIGEAAQVVIDQQSKNNSVPVIRLAQSYIDNNLFQFRASTQKIVKSSITTFIKFMKGAGLAKLERKDLSHEVITRFERYLLETKKLSDNSHGRYMKHLRWLLKTIDFDTKKIKIRSAKKKIITLSMEELTQLEAVDVAFSIEYQKAKDLFLLGCYTGLRVSDIKRLNPDNTRSGMITMKLLKTNKEVKIPIIANAAQILAKYQSRAPKLSEQALNECIKEVCKKAGIDTPTVVDSTKAGHRISKTVPKHSLITSHIAGKTFITLAPEKWGLTPAEIADIVGKDLRTLLTSYFGDKSEPARIKIMEADSRAKMKIVS